MEWSKTNAGWGDEHWVFTPHPALHPPAESLLQALLQCNTVLLMSLNGVDWVKNGCKYAENANLG